MSRLTALAETLFTSVRVLDKQYHAVPNDQYEDAHPNAPSVGDANRNVPPNVDGGQCAPNDEPNDGRNDDGVGVDNVQPHS